MQHALRLLVLLPAAFALLAGCSEGRATPAPPQSTAPSERAVQDVDALLVGGEPVQIEFRATPGVIDYNAPERVYWRTNGTQVRVDTLFRDANPGAWGYFTFHGDAAASSSDSDRLCDWDIDPADSEAGVFYGGCNSWGTSGGVVTDWVKAMTHALIRGRLPPERIAGHEASCFIVKGLALLNETKICIADDLHAPLFMGKTDGTGFIATRVDRIDTSSLKPTVPRGGQYAMHPVDDLLLPSGLPDW